MSTVTPQSADGNPERRDEEPLQRADRNFTDLLQELRVVLTGVQVLFGFLLTVVFSARYGDLDDVQHGVYVATLCFAATSSVFLLAPVAAHRLVFARGRKRELVVAGHRMALVGLFFLGLTLAAGLLLVLDIAVSRPLAVAMTAVLLVLTVVLWVVVPLLLRR